MKTKKQNKIQKRSIEVIEYEDGTFKIDGAAWELEDLNQEEAIEAFMHWANNNLETYPSTIEPPKLITDNS